MNDLTNQLRGKYTVPINDGAGPLDGSTEFKREFEVPAIHIEAADMIENLEGLMKHFEATTSSGEAWCFYNAMTTPQKQLYCDIIGSKFDPEQPHRVNP